MINMTTQTQTQAQAELDCLKGCLKGCLIASTELTCSVIAVFGAGAVISAADGALSAAIGFELMRTTQNWTEPGFTLANTVESQVYAALCFSPFWTMFGWMVYDYTKQNWNNNNNISPYNIELLACIGCASAIVNTAINALQGFGVSFVNMGYGSKFNKLGFMSAVGAAGGAVLMLAIFSSLILSRIAYLLYATNACTLPTCNFPSKAAMLNCFTNKQRNAAPLQNTVEITNVIEAETIEIADGTKPVNKNSPKMQSVLIV